MAGGLVLDRPEAWTLPGAAPRYATRRDFSRSTDGPRIGRIAAALGKPFMPWQQYCADVATERDAFGALVYEVVVVTVPRQSGKTTLLGPVQLDRAMHEPGIKTFYTAQTGKDARSRFNDLVELIGASPLRRMCSFRFAAGSEAIRWPNGSANRLFAPVKAALHGETPPLVLCDEVWEWDEPLGDAIVEGAVFPAQLTLSGRRQLWLVSTAGTAASVFLKKWIEKARAGGARIALFDWGIDEGADPYDLDTLRGFHPAVGFTVTAEELLGQSTAHGGNVGHAAWMRGYCNAWTEAADPLMPADEWATLAKPMEVPSRRELTLTYDVAIDGLSGDVVASWWADGRPHTRLVHHAPGTAWMHDYLVQLYREWRPAILGADDGKPNRRLTDQLRRTLGEEAVQTTSGRDYLTASAAFLAYAMEEKSLVHDGSRTFARAIAGAVLARTGEGVSFSRVRSSTSPASLIAAAIGLWLAEHEEAGGSNDVPDLASLLGGAA